MSFSGKMTSMKWVVNLDTLSSNFLWLQKPSIKEWVRKLFPFVLNTCGSIHNERGDHAYHLSKWNNVRAKGLTTDLASPLKCGLFSKINGALKIQRFNGKLRQEFYLFHGPNWKHTKQKYIYNLKIKKTAIHTLK